MQLEGMFAAADFDEDGVVDLRFELYWVYTDPGWSSDNEVSQWNWTRQMMHVTFLIHSLRWVLQDVCTA